MVGRLRRVLLIAAALLAAPAGAPVAQAASAPRVSVMTRNLFLGANVVPLAGPAPGGPFEQAASNVLAAVRASDPDARMGLVAAEIAKAKPDLVGLQEVSLWRTGPAPASHVEYDFVKAIRARLARLRAGYRLVALRLPFNVEGPTSGGFDLRLTLGDAVLARRGVRVSRVRSRIFDSQLTIDTRAIGPVRVTRGWNAMDATVRGVRLRFVNTHLEASSPDIRAAQAWELVRGPLRSRRPTVLVGDLNSGPALEQPADRLAYAAISGAGFKERRTPTPSCCFDDDLRSGGWDHDVDHVMTTARVRLVRSFLVGSETTASGVHPSDHGGVVSVLRVGR